MKKESIIVIILGLLAIIALIVTIVMTFNLKDSTSPKEDTPKQTENSIKNSDEVVAYATYSGYLSGIDIKEDSKQIIKSQSELKKFLSNNPNYDPDKEDEESDNPLYELAEKYDKDYFTDHNLALVYVSLSSGMDSVEFKSAKVSGNTVTLKYKVVTPKGAVTCDMSGYFVIAEVDKNVTEVKGVLQN